MLNSSATPRKNCGRRVLVVLGGVAVDDVPEDQRIEQREDLVDRREEEREDHEAPVRTQVAIESRHVERVTR
jgi:hypothetical protein